MMNLIYESLTNSCKQRKTAFLTPIVGVALQIISWVIIFPIGVAVEKSFIGTAIVTIVSFFWFFIPLASLFGYYAGVKYIKQNGNDFVAIVGVFLNVVWFLLFLFVCFLVFVVGI